MPASCRLWDRCKSSRDDTDGMRLRHDRMKGLTADGTLDAFSLRLFTLEKS